MKNILHDEAKNKTSLKRTIAFYMVLIGIVLSIVTFSLCLFTFAQKEVELPNLSRSLQCIEWVIAFLLTGGSATGASTLFEKLKK